MYNFYTLFCYNCIHTSEDTKYINIPYILKAEKSKGKSDQDSES